MTKSFSEIFGAENENLQMIDVSRLYLVEVVRKLSPKKEERGVLEKDVEKEIFRRMNKSKKFRGHFFLGPGIYYDLHNKDSDSPTIHSMLNGLASSAGLLRKLRIEPNEYIVTDLGKEVLKKRRSLFSKYLT